MIGCVLLTRGDRPTELQRAVSSIRAQRGVETDIVVVVNSDDHAPFSTEGVTVVRPGENLGIPGGRNLGTEHVSGELILFLDDDAELVGQDLLVRAERLFAEDPRLGIISMGLVDPEGRAPQRRHVPRLRVGDPTRSSEVTTFLGGAAIVRRKVFGEVGLFPAGFFYAHEELDLAWRAIDRGWRVRYVAELVIRHPSVPPTRHPDYHRLTLRNRVLLARRRLPWPLAVVHVLVWILISAARRSLTRASCQGLLEGLRDPDVERDPIRWATAWRMTKLGRPPIV